MILLIAGIVMMAVALVLLFKPWYVAAFLLIVACVSFISATSCHFTPHGY